MDPNNINAVTQNINDIPAIKEIINNNYNEGEKYILLYKELNKIFKDEKKLALFYQVGDFYEIYALIYPNGDRVGNLWDIASELNLSISTKKNKVFKDDSIILKMIGIPIWSLDKYLSLAVNDYGWTIVLFAQVDTEYGKKKRIFDQIISPGLITNSSSESNNMMVIYLESIKSIRNKGIDILYSGISFIDTLTGDIGTIQYPFKENINESVIYDEIIKLITIKNPKDILIYSKNLNLKEKEIVEKLRLHYYNYKIYMNDIPKDFSNIEYQTNLFENVFKYHIDNMNNSTNRATHESTGESKDETTNETTNVNMKLHILDYLNIKDYYFCVISLTILLEYIIKRNNSLIYRLNKPTLFFNVADNLILQNNSLEQLNIVNNQTRNFTFEKTLSLITLLDKTKSQMGKRTFRNRLMNPITNTDILNKSYKQITAFTNLQIEEKNKIKDILLTSVDIAKIKYKLTNNTMHYNQISSLNESINLFVDMNTILIKTVGTHLLVKSKQFCDSIHTLASYIKTQFNIDYLSSIDIKNNENNGNIFNKGIHVELDALDEKIQNDNGFIDQLIRRLTILIDEDFYIKGKDKKGKTLINKLENTKLNTYITTTKSRIDSIKNKFSKKGADYSINIGCYKLKKGDFNFTEMSKGKWRIDTKCIVESGHHLNGNISLLQELTKTIFKEKLDYMYEKYVDLIQELCFYFGEIDFIQSCAVVAAEFGYICPIIQDGDGDSNTNNSFIDVKDIRHPLIEQINKDVQYVANDICLGKENENGILLFGVNAVGKSSLMKSIGCCIIMAQSGMFVPASSFVYKPFKYLFTRICNGDNIFAGLSTFEVEMREFKNIMHYADKNSIILGDEICSGTETMDATAIVASGINILAKRKSNFLFATHLHYLSKSEYITSLENVKCKHMSVTYDEKSKSLFYVRKLQNGSGSASYGIEICKSMNMDRDFMDMAQNIRDNLGDDTQLILGKKSKYNNDKIISNCEVCLVKLAVDTHHIKFQCTADNQTGMIEHWHKDSKFNLVGLCKECHQSVHSKPPKLHIEGYITTTHGIKLDYKKLDAPQGGGDSSNQQDIQLNDEQIQTMIKNYHSRNLTIRQIQNRLKESNVKKTQKEITALLV